MRGGVTLSMDLSAVSRELRYRYQLLQRPRTTERHRFEVEHFIGGNLVAPEGAPAKPPRRHPALCRRVLQVTHRASVSTPSRPPL